MIQSVLAAAQNEHTPVSWAIGVLLVLSLALVLFIIIGLVIAMRPRDGRRGRRGRRPDPWSESARRMPTPPKQDPGPEDTVPYDGVDLIPDDIEPGGPRRGELN